MARARTLALCGLDREEEAALRGFFDAAVKRCGIPWVIAAESEADALLIDVDSMYGQMSWLRAQGGPRPIVALTAAPRADADFLLARPANPEGLSSVLGMLAERISPRSEATPDATPAAAPTTTPAPKAAPAAPRAATPAAEQKTAEQPDTLELPLPDETPQAALEPPPKRDLRLVDFLRGGLLPGAVRLRDAQPPLVIDPIGKTYLGGVPLKPFLPISAEILTAERWEAITPHEFERLRTELGGEQPLGRLLWLAGLGSTHGRVMEELATASRFKLARYPTTEREFPKHIRIATSMLKQLATIDEIASASGAAREDVVDFINACAALGLVEDDRPATQPDTPEAAKGGGLLGRLRRR